MLGIFHSSNSVVLCGEQARRIRTNWGDSHGKQICDLYPSAHAFSHSSHLVGRRFDFKHHRLFFKFQSLKKLRNS